MLKMSLKLLLFTVCLCYFTVDIAALTCYSVQNGHALAKAETCAQDVGSCLKKINKGTKQYVQTCDRAHQCKAGDTSFSDGTYDYYCCSGDMCNSSFVAKAGAVSLAVVLLKIWFL
ncbi:unnamed protein product [Bursaphelenchus xylophilus]|uniref:(pine wood nematode) hypothetical protein n=1 Tax=Bursaphelenchus xylophilus TaxID=6326 RepID=A0A1I7RP16_BURXY|nr:unnamed protein product [Bursaphelenchus xylophilus]CAG9124453.1 unnamed protein product [Bursaphelenchus xylophilus]